MVRPHAKSESAAILTNVVRVQRLLPQAKHAALLAKGTTNESRANAAVRTLEQSLQTLKRRQAQLSGEGATPQAKRVGPARSQLPTTPTTPKVPKLPQSKPAPKTRRCPVCSQTLPASKSGRLLKHRLSTGRMCTEGVEPLPLQQQKKPKKNGQPDKFTRQTAWAMQHAVSAGLPGLGKRS